MRRYACILIGILCFLTVLTSCRRSIVYSQFVPVAAPQDVRNAAGAWHMNEAAHFDYTVADTTEDYQMIVYIRHTERYPYQNMWLFVSDSMRCDTIEFYLADDRGQWLGDRHHGFIEMPVLLESNKHFSDTGIYHLNITHAMRDSLLRGVTDVGLEIRTNGKE